MLGNLLGILLSVVTITDKGLVFQPALSPDGSQVAFARDEGEGGVKICIAPSAGGPAVPVGCTIGYGAQGVHSAATSLLHAAWAPDGKHLLFLALRGCALPVTVNASAVAAPPSHLDIEPSVGLFVVGVDGQNPAEVGPRTGIVDAASFLPSGRILYAWREARGSQTSLWSVDPVKGNALPVFDFEKDVVAIDLAVSADGAWASALTLTGPRDEKVRGLCALELGSKKLSVIESPSTANFLSWAGQTLLFSQHSDGHKLMTWKPGDEKPALAADQFWYAIGTAGGTLAFGLASDDQFDGLCAIDLGKHEDKELSDGYVPTSAASGKIAVVRRTAAGAAILVVDVTPEMIVKGDVGLPQPQPEPAPAPAQPPLGAEPPAEEKK